MVDIKMKTTGLKELQASLVALQKEYGGKAATQAMRPAVKAAMAPVLSDVQARTPVATGTLSASSKMKIGKPTKKMVSSDHYTNKAIIYGQVGWFWSKPSLWSQALAVEFGTRTKTASSTLRGAIEGDSTGIIKRFKDTLGPSIEKKAKALHKKRSK